MKIKSITPQSYEYVVFEEEFLYSKEFLRYSEDFWQAQIYNVRQVISDPTVIKVLENAYQKFKNKNK